MEIAFVFLASPSSKPSRPVGVERYKEVLMSSIQFNSGLSGRLCGIFSKYLFAASERGLLNQKFV